MSSCARKLPSRILEKVWGAPDTAPWLEPDGRRIGEVWFDPESMPIRIKFIFTSERLSVQVHPAGVQSKTEMWYILRTGEGASLALGFREEISLEHMRVAAEDGSIEQLLHWLPIAPGETYFVPAGTVHAIGANVVLCEIQQKLDLTYRLYDYARPRELHLEQALEWAVGAPWTPHRPPHNARRPWQRLVECRYFVTDLTSTDKPFDVEPCALVVVAGSGAIAGEPFQVGECWEIEGGPVRVEPCPGTRLLRTMPPLV